MVTLIENGLIVTMDPKRTIIKDGAIVIEGDHILDVGEESEIKRKYKPSKKLNAKDKLILPGLIDAHAHLTEILHRGCEGNLSLIDWLTTRAWPLGGAVSEEDAKIATSLCCLEMLKSGTTCFVEPMLYSKRDFNGIAETIQEVGIRGVLAKALMGKVGYGLKEENLTRDLKEDSKSSLAEAIAMIKKWDGQAEGRIKVWLGPRVASACTEELGRQVSEVAEEFHTGITLHFAEVREDTDQIKVEHGRSPAEYLQRIGLLKENVLLCHAIWLDPEDIDLLAASGANVVHCPSSNLKLASGFAKIPEMLRKGIPVALGCDGGMANGCYDMFREMKLTSLIHRGVTLDPLSITAERVLEMATIKGARALSMEDEIGSIEAGKKADLIMIDLRKPHLVPLLNTVSNIVYSATGSDVDTVIINGKLIMQHRRVLTVDEEGILREAQSRAQTIVERTAVAKTWSR